MFHVLVNAYAEFAYLRQSKLLEADRAVATTLIVPPFTYDLVSSWQGSPDE